VALDHLGWQPFFSGGKARLGTFFLPPPVRWRMHGGEVPPPQFVRECTGGSRLLHVCRTSALSLSHTHTQKIKKKENTFLCNSVFYVVYIPLPKRTTH
jgi:hypothetical protein